MKITSELKTGIVALVAIGAFIWGYSYIKGKDLFNSNRYFYAEYDNVQGLEPSGAVTINGFKVGKVDEVYFHPKKVGKLVVKFSLDNSYKFSKKSTAQIYSPDLISGKAINLLASYDGTTAVSGDTLQGSIDAGLLGSLSSQIQPLQGKLQNLSTNANQLLKGLNNILDDSGQANLKKSFASLSTTLQSFNGTSNSLNKLLSKNGKLDSILTNATTASLNLAKLTDSLNNANLKATISKLENTLTSFNSILAKVDKGEGSIGKLLKDEGLYKNLEGASKEMEELLKDFKEHPKRFVHFSLFGKKAKPYKETAEDSKE